MPLIRFSIKNPLITNLSLVIVIILGVLSWNSMPQEMFPSMELDAVSITVKFEGASPEEVERQVIIPRRGTVRGHARDRRHELDQS